MDWRMRGMDGAETARRILDLLGEDRPPLVLLSASIEPSARLEELGLDDFLPRPYSPQQLRTTVERWLRPGDDDPKSARFPPSTAPEGSVVDLSTLLGFTLSGPDSELTLPTLLTTCRDNLSDRMEQMREAVQRQDAAEIEVAAHSIKSISAMLGARQLSELCREIEFLAGRGGLDRCLKLVPTASRQMDAVKLDLERLLEAHQKP